jgi:hypothetical protein
MEEKTEARAICPNCKSCNVMPLVGALPGFTPWDSINPIRIPVAVCDEGGETAGEWRCEDCGAEWGSGGEAEAGE